MLNKWQNNIAIDPEYQISRNNSATVLLQNNQLEAAIWHDSLHRNLEPLDIEALFNRENSLRLTGHLHEAIDKQK